MPFTIPTRFKIANHTITVRTVRPSRWKHGRCDAAWWPSKSCIDLRSGLTGTHREQRFFHELTHCILDTAGESALNGNEDFVDKIAALLAQAMATAE